MKQKFYPVICAIVIALFFSTSLSAQSSLIIGNFAGSSEAILGTRYRNVRTTNSDQSQATFTGIPDLGSSRSGSRVDGNITYGNSGTFTFVLTYDVANNRFTTTTTANGTTRSNILPDVSGRSSRDGKQALATNINLMTLAVRTQTGSSTISVSNLTIDGMPVTGTYGRSNNNGESFWHISTSTLNNGFVITGTVTMSGNFANNAEGQRISFTFGNAATAGAPLPVVWGGFAGKRVNSSSIGLQWRTLQEQNASHYNIQRSEDGVHFRTIAMAMAQGTTASVTDYNFEDKQATGNMYYYRLEQVDLNGTSNFSTIIKLGNGGKKTLVGGLGSNKILVQFFSNDNRSLRIVNNSGVIVKQMNSTTQQETLDVNNLPTGVYALQIINSDGTSEVHRFVK
ncbi:MAG: T9SS type A sorting domain-containing protein [Lacibacter sp.]